MNVRVLFTRQLRYALTVPADAIIHEEKRSHVYVQQREEYVSTAARGNRK
jgi:hypothetical protein